MSRVSDVALIDFMSDEAHVDDIDTWLKAVSDVAGVPAICDG